MITDAISKIVKRQNLDFETTRAVIEEIADGRATDAQIAAFLTAIRMKGETVDEITAAAAVMKEKCTPVKVEGNIIDIVGTGGDGASTFNISTACAFIVSAGGLGVAKHGSRSASGKVGSADLLEAIGANINTNSTEEEEIFKKTNICFMHAPNHHPSMKYVTRARQEIKIRTFFNILGPLVNPAGAKKQLLGVFCEDLVYPMARAMSNLGVEDGIVIYGLDGLDEASVCTDTLVCEAHGGNLTTYKINPQDFGLGIYEPASLKSTDIKENIAIINDIFSNTLTGAKRDIVVLNSALAFYAAGHVKTIFEGTKLAKDVLNKGLAKKKLEDFIKATNEVK